MGVQYLIQYLCSSTSTLNNVVASKHADQGKQKLTTPQYGFVKKEKKIKDKRKDKEHIGHTLAGNTGTSHCCGVVIK